MNIGVFVSPTIQNSSIKNNVAGNQDFFRQTLCHNIPVYSIHLIHKAGFVIPFFLIIRFATVFFTDFRRQLKTQSIWNTIRKSNA